MEGTNIFDWICWRYHLKYSQVNLETHAAGQRHSLFMTFKQKKKENSPSKLELSDLCYHMEKFPALERPTFAMFNFSFVQWQMRTASLTVTRRRSWKVRRAVVQGACWWLGRCNSVPSYWVWGAAQRPCRRLLGKAWMSETGQGGPVRSLSLWLHSRDSGAPCPHTYLLTL